MVLLYGVCITQSTASMRDKECSQLLDIRRELIGYISLKVILAHIAAMNKQESNHLSFETEHNTFPPWSKQILEDIISNQDTGACKCGTGTWATNHINWFQITNLWSATNARSILPTFRQPKKLPKNIKQRAQSKCTSRISVLRFFQQGERNEAHRRPVGPQESEHLIMDHIDRVQSVGKKNLQDS